MQMQVEWSRAIPLMDGKNHNLIYYIDPKKVPTGAGIYIFGRRWGRDIEALYVGMATDLRRRMTWQLNNLRLMRHLQKAKTGKRIVVFGTISCKPGQRLGKCLVLVERALIRHFLSEGHDLVNKQGTRLRRHEITSSGKHSKRFIPNHLYLEKAKGRLSPTGRWDRADTAPHELPIRETNLRDE